jgi:MmyB-like transcription regulator ligand binding domain
MTWSSALRANSDRFAERWDPSAVGRHEATLMTIDHPHAGTLTLDRDVLTVAGNHGEMPRAGSPCIPETAPAHSPWKQSPGVFVRPAGCTRRRAKRTRLEMRSSSR